MFSFKKNVRKITSSLLYGTITLNRCRSRQSWQDHEYTNATTIFLEILLEIIVWNWLFIKLLGALQEIGDQSNNLWVLY